MSAARFRMQRSFPFIPRSVSRKPNQEKRPVASTELAKAVADTTAGKDVSASTSVVGQKDLDKQSIDHQNRISLGDTLRTSPDKDLGSEANKTSASSHANKLETEKSGSELPVSSDKNGLVTERDTTPVKESDSPTCKQSDTAISPEHSGFSFSKFVESVCKHNNLDLSSKENQPDPQTASTSDNVQLSSPDKKQSTETTGFSFQSFAEAVYKQNNFPLIDVGALSPRRKVALFTRQNSPLYVPKQPIFDASALKETRTAKGRDFSVLTSKQSASYGQAVEPASKRFKEAAAKDKGKTGKYTKKKANIKNQMT